MTLRFLDGFDHYTGTGGVQRKYEAYTTTLPASLSAGTGTTALDPTVGGRFGGGYLLANGYSAFPSAVCATRRLPALRTTLVVGFALFVEAVNTGTHPRLCRWAGPTAGNGLSPGQCDLAVDADGRLEVFRATTGAGTLLDASAPGVVPFHAWVYVQWKVTIGSSGSYEVRLYDTPVLTGTGDTMGTVVDAGADRLLVGNPINTALWQYRLDDLYVCDADGAANNDFLGDTRIATLLPNGAGASTTWSPSGAGENWQAVDEASPNDDTDYVATATAGQLETYTLPDVTTPSGLVRGLQWSALARKDDAGARTLRPVLRTGGANYEGADVVVLDSYAYAPQVFETNPGTGATWTVAEVNALEAGQKLQA